MSKEYEITYAEMKAFDNEFYEGFEVNWGAKNIGFGQVILYMDKKEEGNKLYCDNETMSKEFVKAVFDKLIESAEFKE